MRVWKGLKRWQKVWLVVGVILLLSITSLFCLTYDPELQKCIENKKIYWESKSAYDEKRIEIMFENNVTEEQARKIIRSLDIDDYISGSHKFGDHWFFYIGVPNKETGFVYLCKFQKHEEVKVARFELILYSHQGLT